MKSKLNRAQKEDKRESEAFRKKENKSYKEHLKKRKEEKKADKIHSMKHSKSDLQAAHKHMKEHGG